MVYVCQYLQEKYFPNKSQGRGSQANWRNRWNMRKRNPVFAPCFRGLMVTVTISPLACGPVATVHKPYVFTAPLSQKVFPVAQGAVPLNSHNLFVGL